MATTNRRATAPEHERSLPDLVPFDGDHLTAGGDYDAVDFVDGDFTGQDAADARILACRLRRCCLERLSLRRARILDSLMREVHGASVDLADSTWRGSHLSRARFGAMGLAGATWDGVRVRDSKLGFVNLAGARLEDVAFEGCEIGGLDAQAAQLRSVTFAGCTIDEINVSEATLFGVDLSAARLRSLIGVENLKGAIVSQQQLLDLAPILAAQLGLEVRPDRPPGNEGRLS